MFPLVPYHACRNCTSRMKDDCPAPCASTWAAYKEIVPALFRQLRDPEWYIRRDLPAGAAPFNEPTPLNDGRALPLPAKTAA